MEAVFDFCSISVKVKIKYRLKEEHKNYQTFSLKIRNVVMKIEKMFFPIPANFRTSRQID